MHKLDNFKTQFTILSNIITEEMDASCRSRVIQQLETLPQPQTTGQKKFRKATAITPTKPTTCVSKSELLKKMKEFIGLDQK